MTYAVTDNCIKCKYMDCVHCGECEPECPVEAILPDGEPHLEKWLKLNAEYARIWPNITIKREPPADAKDFDCKPNKLESYFSSQPGRGN
jgi:ferredoxin